MAKHPKKVHFNRLKTEPESNAIFYDGGCLHREDVLLFSIFPEEEMQRLANKTYWHWQWGNRPYTIQPDIEMDMSGVQLKSLARFTGTGQPREADAEAQQQYYTFTLITCQQLAGMNYTKHLSELRQFPTQEEQIFFFSFHTYILIPK